MARDNAFFGTGQLPKFEFDQFWTLSGENFVDEAYLAQVAQSSDLLEIQLDVTARFRDQKSNRFGLIPTAEVPLTNYVADEIVRKPNCRSG